MVQSLRLGHAEEQIHEARKRVEEQEAKLQCLIVNGAPTQATEDLLYKLHETLKRMTRQARSFR